MIGKKYESNVTGNKVTVVAISGNRVTVEGVSGSRLTLDEFDFRVQYRPLEAKEPQPRPETNERFPKREPLVK